MIQELKNSYGHLFEVSLLEEICRVGTFKEIPEGFKMIEIGQYVKSMPLLISGAIKILRDDSDGDELLLYFLEKGDIERSSFFVNVSGWPFMCSVKTGRPGTNFKVFGLGVSIVWININLLILK